MSELLDPLPSDDREQPVVPREFTDEQYEWLADIAMHNPEIVERQIDERHLKFAKWLVEHGKLSEEL